MLFLPRFALELSIFLAFRVNAGVNRCNHKGTLKRRQIKKIGRFPAELLQTVVCIVGLRITVLYQFFASSTSSLSVLKPLTLKTSVT